MANRAAPGQYGVTHWSSRLLGRHLGIGNSTVATAWREYGVQPWRSLTFKFSTDPELVAKVTDVVGLYLAPPENATAPTPGVPGVPQAGRPRLPDRRAAPRDGQLRRPSTHRGPTWLAANPRIRVHFTPTSGSWLNLVEIWFGIIERQAIHRGAFGSVKDLNAKIRAFITGWNDRCHPFTWTKTPDQILTKANRQTTSDTGH